MEYILVNEWYVYWYATVMLSLLTWLSIVTLSGTVFIVSVVYDIVKQISSKWSTKN